NPGACNDTFGTRTPAASDTVMPAGNVGTAYNHAVSGLAQGTTYYVCAIAQNSVGTAFGNVFSFTTPSPPAVTTTSAAVANNSATLNGFANPDRDATTGSFRYDTANPGTCNDTFGPRLP